METNGQSTADDDGRKHFILRKLQYCFKWRCVICKFLKINLTMKFAIIVSFLICLQ